MVSGGLHGPSRFAFISRTDTDGVTGFTDGVPLLLVGVPNDAFSNMARVAANVGSRLTLPTESLPALASLSDGDR